MYSKKRDQRINKVVEVFAYAYNLVILYMKNLISPTPLN